MHGGIEVREGGTGREGERQTGGGTDDRRDGQLEGGTEGGTDRERDGRKDG